MTKELLLSSVGFGLFVVCPRMAGMMNIITNNSQVSIIKTVFLGMLISVPLLFLMIFTFKRFGVLGALIFCVLTDLGAALIMKNMSLKAGIQTLVIAVFVLIGVKIAPLICDLFIKS